MLVGRTGLSQANVSKHLQQMLALGFVAREKDGLFTRYRPADRDVYRLCDLMCGRVDREARVRERQLGTARRL